jgi:hypothetical protein
MARIKQLLLAEISPLVVSLGLGAIFWFWLGLLKGLLLFVVVLLVLQPFVLFPLFRKGGGKGIRNKF